MAPPTKTVPHPGRALAALGVLIVIMLLGIVGGNLFTPSQWHKDFKVGLGLDLSSGTQLSMQATTLNGGIPSADELNEAKSIILERVNSTGNTGAEVQTQGNNILNVSVPGKTTQQTEQLVSETALLNFRQTLLYQPHTATATPSASSSATVYGDKSLVDKHVLELFNKLTCTPGDTTKWKQQVGYTNAEAYDNPNVQIVSCDNAGNKYALDVAKVQGTQIGNAIAEVSTTNNQWEVLLSLKSAGASAFGALTSEQASKYLAGAQAGNQDDFWLDTVAVVLDGNVITAPETTQAIPGGNAQITGNFTQAQATQLQDVLKYGSLPLNFTILSESTVSAQLGRAQLVGGLIAAAIGLFLVVAYSFLYYRGLGLVSVSSLLVAGLLALLSVILLTKYQNFALELSGIAGLIVAIGITADSFVVFFERLRDEVREGKQLRPAVEAGWKRARRTILVSDTVSFIAAVLLYYFSIGEVKGFAYTLGLTTIIDVVVVFLFTKPVVTLLARTKFYGNGHPLSGLDPTRLGARAPWRSSVPRAAVRRRPDTVARSTSAGGPRSRNTGEA